MAGNNALLLLIALLAISNIFSFNAAPISRNTRLFLHENQELPPPAYTNQMMKLEAMEEEFINGRMDLESHDYPGSGANNRHTPRPPIET
ncbi:uncharacterized protein LOC107767789 [Nicotiana tabacum]|uniref:Uncharacterized protein LOC107767789 n=1 Tax=Nicotiana tabacum TaxID=4097 RepID=A0A1S3XR63_TOBAC|nr:PREDICTED: uncharacterized protein LOC107767789 [Nicotiana tabacum]